ncbi:hypothetical protein [Chelativorans sp. M5D2P16]|uniref:hypothetical protein n=1 Tax=Chelativorans sp. M5D2P16 TaxID=3095678 RepID=UPI002ACAB5BD|nr:hypothetical protein [Chelativorans sp. M5D2P16]MDZ5698695.1 hypothetical protein [Chelativorans sp. M5D2P16]
MEKIAGIDRRVAIPSADEGRESETQRVSDLRGEPYVVLLGEPGIGKSTVFRIEAEQEGGTLLRVRQLVNGSRPPPGTTLFIDALDEYRSDGSAADKADKLAQAIAESKVARWRLSCRSEDWRNASDIAAIQSTTAGHDIVVAHLLPLEETEASPLLAAWGEPDPGAFLEQASRMGVAAFAQNPLGLRMLNKAVQRNGTWPSTRFAVMAEGTRQLAHEHNSLHTHDRGWPGAHAIIEAAARSCLMLLTTGAQAIWRSNAVPPELGEHRALPTLEDLGLSARVFGDMLDTPLFRGEGDAFEPMHRVVAEFLAAKALADAVIGSKNRATLPLSRAVAMITSSDGRPPTELRGLYAWLAAHLAEAGDAAGARRLIEADAVTVLAYGDAAIFRTSERRAILENIGSDDPYFRSSESGITAFGGLAGEDLADDFRAILTGPVNSQKFITVFDALTIGHPVHSLRPLLREIALDSGRESWHRWRAADAWLNGAEDATVARLELLDALDREALSSSREVLRLHIAAEVPSVLLGATRLRSIVGDFDAAPDDNTIGHLFSLGRRLECEPLPELLDEFVSSWRPPQGSRHRAFEVDSFLDRLAAHYIATLSPDSRTVWRWTRNLNDDESLADRHREETRKALSQWFDADPRHECEILDLILKEYQPIDPKNRPWQPAHDYFRFAKRPVSRPLAQYILTQAAEAASGEERRWVEKVAVFLVKEANADPSAYWSVYDYLTKGRGRKRLLAQLVASKLSGSQLRHRSWQIKRSRENARRRTKDIAILSSQLEALREGRHHHNLFIVAENYLRKSKDDGLAPFDWLVAELNEPVAVAVRSGWQRLVTQPPDFLTTAALGRAAGQNEGWRIEHAVVAGLDLMLRESCVPANESIPVETALIALKSGVYAEAEERRDAVYDWAAARLGSNSDEGIAALTTFWIEGLEAGGDGLDGLWPLTRPHRVNEVVRRAFWAVLEARPNMHEAALKHALTEAFDLFEPIAIGELAQAALTTAGLTLRQELLWTFVAFSVAPGATRDRLLTLSRRASPSDLAFLGLDRELGSVVQGLDHAFERLEVIALMAGAHSTPEGRHGRSGRVNDVHHLADATTGAITSLSMQKEAPAGDALLRLSLEPSLEQWRQSILHALAEQMRLRRDEEFRHPTAAQIADALAGGAPVNASDLRAIAREELVRLRDELRTVDTGDWKMCWNRDGNIAMKPLHENECRDYLLSRLRDRMSKYRIAAAAPEAQRAGETRADMLILSGAGGNLPVEVKRHYHPEVWTAAATQLQGYASAPDADGLGIYLVIWFGADVQPMPPRSDGTARPTAAAELEGMLIADLPEGLRERTEVIVFDVSRTQAEIERLQGRRARRPRSAGH